MSSPPPMENSPEQAVKQPASAGVASEQETFFERWSFRVQFVLSLAITIGVLIYLLQAPDQHQDQHASGDHVSPQALTRVLRPVGQNLLEIDEESSLFQKLALQTIEFAEVNYPKLRVTGTIVASLRPIGEDDRDQWQFDEPEVLETFHEWRRALIDIDFAQEQVKRIRELTDSRILAQTKIVERLERLVSAGTDTVADLEEARAELLEREIEGRKEIHEAETELRQARQSEAVLVRQLQLAGLDPEMLLEATSDVDIVVADVPEESQQLVHLGQMCEARFFGMRKEVFTGVVRNIAPVLSLERRSLRVLFFVNDLDDKLRPGMFADIGMGTEQRQTILVPENSIIHIGREDYVFVDDQHETPLSYPSDDKKRSVRLRVAQVEVGDTIDGKVEIFSGLQGGERLVTAGAILLKPTAAESLLLPPAAPVEGSTETSSITVDEEESP